MPPRNLRESTCFPFLVASVVGLLKIFHFLKYPQFVTVDFFGFCVVCLPLVFVLFCFEVEKVGFRKRKKRKKLLVVRIGMHIIYAGDNENIKKHIQAIKNSGPLKQCGTRLVALLICMSVPTMLCADLSEQRQCLNSREQSERFARVCLWVREGLWYQRQRQGGCGERTAPTVVISSQPFTA